MNVQKRRNRSGIDQNPRDKTQRSTRHTSSHAKSFLSRVMGCEGDCHNDSERFFVKNRTAKIIMA